MAVQGELFIRTEAPALGKAWLLGVFVDGVRVGKVRQGESGRFAVEPGTRSVRVGVGGGRSNTITVEVGEGAPCPVTAYNTGYSMMVTIVPLILGVLAFIPGFVFRLRAGVVAPAVVPEESVQGPAGLWWESDPKLAKRYGKSGTS
ncbi:hypothetical protein P3T36_005607 [Kitasatospora sp. MAP12-15]|uniref:hypothetical protein n=1 Tax=unclassified Kitasatospora TaxID=2633591 RepID=UPI0024768286|nr:hypothetical protein [Kitasatospora sp. MAP12-44]MDH6113128.1 hypothetical protein [Kitasatospora sp. MAP12-44]